MGNADLLPVIDTHTHLADVEDIAGVLLDAEKAVISDLIVLGTDLPSNQKHLDVAAKALAPRIHVALGLHPGSITSDEMTDNCFELMRQNVFRAMAVGETGLDYTYQWVRHDENARAKQREVFARHLAFAVEFSLPAVIHSRGAWQDCLAMAKDAAGVPAEFHWYSGPLDILDQVLEAGYMVSFSPALEYSEEARQAALVAPMDRILIETDTPVAYPAYRMAGGQGSPHGKRVPSKPGDVRRTLAALALLKKRPENEVLAAVNANARRFFRLPAGTSH